MEDNYDISLEEASTLTRRYREVHGDHNKGVFFPKKDIQELLDQGDCNGIRIYFGCDEEAEDKLKVVIVGTILMENMESCDDILEKIKDRGDPCPPYSSCENPLNS
jgi:hypothetical protein